MFRKEMIMIQDDDLSTEERELIHNNGKDATYAFIQAIEQLKEGMSYFEKRFGDMGLHVKPSGESLKDYASALQLHCSPYFYNYARMKYLEEREQKKAEEKIDSLRWETEGIDYADAKVGREISEMTTVKIQEVEHPKYLYTRRPKWRSYKVYPHSRGLSVAFRNMKLLQYFNWYVFPINN